MHYRILYGPPRHTVLVEHLTKLLQLRDPADRSHGYKTLYIGVIDQDHTPERFFCASDAGAVAIIPSLTAADAFDTGIALGPTDAAGLIGHGREAYAAARKVETLDALTPWRCAVDRTLA